MCLQSMKYEVSESNRLKKCGSLPHDWYIEDLPGESRELEVRLVDAEGGYTC